MNIRGLVLASLGVTLAILVGLSHGSCNPNTGIESFVCTFRESYKIKTSTNCGWWFSSSKCTKYRTGYRIRYSTCTRKCKVDGGWGGWSGWSVWSSCSKTCGSGTKTSTRKRICNNPTPKNGGKPCNVASNTEIKTKSVSCQIVPCPVHGGWSNWSQWGNWGTCSKTCNNGSMTSMRKRTCTNPPPQFGGNECVGSSEDTRSSLCNTFSCPEDICKVVGTGYRPHPADVGKFLYCVAGVVNILNCSEGLEWDQNILTCNWPSIQECTNGEYLPHDTDCTKFLQCSNGVAVEMNCPDGLHWNKSVLVCDYSEDASCDVSDDDSADNDGNNSFQCPQAFGYYPNPNDCGKFYQCSWSVPYEQQCGTDQGWNDEIQTCVLKSELSNCG